MFTSKKNIEIANSNSEKINRFYLNMVVAFHNDEELKNKITHILLSLKEMETREIILDNLKHIDVKDDSVLSSKINEILVNLKYYANEYWQLKYNKTKFK